MVSRRIGKRLICGDFGQKTITAKPHAAGMTIRLKTAVPRIVPTPMSSCEMNVPIRLVNSSGAEVPIAINVAPAMSGGSFRTGRGGTG